VWRGDWSYKPELSRQHGKRRHCAKKNEVERRRRYVERAAEVHTLIAAVFVAVFSPVREHTGSDLTRPRASPSPTTTDRSGSPGAPTTTNNNNSNYYYLYYYYYYCYTARASISSSSGCRKKSNGSRRRASGNERRISERRTAGGVGEPKCGGDWSSANAVS